MLHIALPLMAMMCKPVILKEDTIASILNEFPFVLGWTCITICLVKSTDVLWMEFIGTLTLFGCKPIQSSPITVYLEKYHFPETGSEVRTYKKNEIMW